MLNFTTSIELYYKNYIKDILYRIVDETKQNAVDRVNIDEENTKYLLLTNGAKYFIWISKFNETEFSNVEEKTEKTVNKAIVFIFNKELNKEQWVMIPQKAINWEYSDEYLLEGYLYANEMYFSDCIYPNFNRGYMYRRNVLKGIFEEQPENMVYIKENRSEKDIILGKLINMIEIKDEGVDETMKRMLLRNFKYKVAETEVVEELIKGREVVKITKAPEKRTSEKIEEKELRRGDKIEIYHVYNIDTKNAEGLLLVKTMKQSRMLDEMFKDDTAVLRVKCKFDEKRKKWTLYD